MTVLIEGPTRPRINCTTVYAFRLRSMPDVNGIAGACFGIFVIIPEQRLILVRCRTVDGLRRVEFHNAISPDMGNELATDLKAITAPGTATRVTVTEHPALARSVREVMDHLRVRGVLEWFATYRVFRGGSVTEPDMWESILSGLYSSHVRSTVNDYAERTRH